MGKGPFLQIEKLSKSYEQGRGTSVTVFADIDLRIEKGEFVCLIGHSGCGKSTILNIVAGLDTASSGYAFMEGREIRGPSLDRGVIFQNHSLLPWKSALENVMFSVRARWPGWSTAQVREHSAKFLQMVHLDHAGDRKPAQLSGGMRQRVGIARAFAIAPKMLLMDEPFGALDALTRGSIQDELIELWNQSGQTVLMITHDVDEAIYLADRVLLMSDGPNSRIAEEVVIDLPRPRDRRSLLRDERYAALRARLFDFLVDHGKRARGDTGSGAEVDSSRVSAPAPTAQESKDDSKLCHDVESVERTSSVSSVRQPI